MDTRVLLVDDHAVVRAGIRLVLDGAPGIEVVGEAGTEERALVLARAHRPDVIVLDVLLPGKGGVALVPGLLEAAPGSRVLMLSSSADPGTVQKALEAGATGYSSARPTPTWSRPCRRSPRARATCIRSSVRPSPRAGERTRGPCRRASSRSYG